MDLARIASRIANTTLQVDSWSAPRVSPSEIVGVIFPDNHGPAFSGKFLEYLATRYQMGMTEATETFGTSTDELQVGAELVWDDSNERLWFKIVTVEDVVLAPEVMRSLIENYGLEDLVAKNLESVLTDAAMIAEVRQG